MKRWRWPVDKQTRAFPEIVSGLSWSVSDAEAGRSRTRASDLAQALPYRDEVCPNCGQDHMRAVRVRELVQAKYQAELRGEDWAKTAAEHARGWALAGELARDGMRCPGMVPGLVGGFQEAMVEAGFDPYEIMRRTLTYAYGFSPSERVSVPGKAGEIIRSAPVVGLDDHDGGQAQELVAYLQSAVEDLDGDGEESEMEMVPGGEMPGSLSAHWGKMEVEICPMPHAIPNTLRKRRTAEEGDSIRDITRLHIDGRVFKARSHRPPAGSMLVDLSGSMSWSEEHLLEVVEAAPAALVATYSGQGERGTLRVVARGGRRARDKHITARNDGNVVDGPALAWLGRQKSPRVWFSDGGVTGVNDSCHNQLNTEAEQIRRAIGAVMTWEMDEAIRVITTGRR